MTNRSFKKILIVVILLLSARTAFAAAELHLEGIIEDQQDGRQSMAVINGNMYRVGEVIADWRLSEIGSNFVNLVDSKSGKGELHLTVTGPVPSPSPSPGASPTLIGQARKYLTNPGLAVVRAWELRTLRDIALINNAAVKYYEKNGFFPTGLRQLTLDGYLPEAYENGKTSKYQFYFRNTPQQPHDFQFHADPLDPNSGLLYFFVGADAVIRESQGQPANPASPEHRFIAQRPPGERY